MSKNNDKNMCKNNGMVRKAQAKALRALRALEKNQTKQLNVSCQRFSGSLNCDTRLENIVCEKGKVGLLEVKLQGSLTDGGFLSFMLNLLKALNGRDKFEMKPLDGGSEIKLDVTIQDLESPKGDIILKEFKTSLTTVLEIKNLFVTLSQVMKG